MSEPKLIKIDRNGSKHYEGLVKCDRCGGDGIYKWGAVINGRPQYAGTCFKCLGAGTVIDTWIERTPEYEAKLAAKRAEKAAAREAKYAAINAKGSMHLVLKEFSPRGNHTGTFDGQRELRGDGYVGTFTNSKGKKYHFELMQQYE